MRLKVVMRVLESGDIFLELFLNVGVLRAF